MTEIFSTFSGKLLRFPGNSLFLSSFWNVWLFLNFISPFISLEKTVLGLYFDTKWVHLIYVIRNVFQPKKKAIQAALISSLESHFTSLLCHSLGCFCKTQLHWSHPWKKQENWRHRRGNNYRVGQASSGWQHSTLDTAEAAWLLCVECNLTIFYELDVYLT